MRKFVTVLLLSAIIFNPLTAYASNSNVYKLHPYSLLTQLENGADSKGIELSELNVDRGIYSYTLYHLLHPSEQFPPKISAELKAKYGYSKYTDKRFNSLMKDYSIWAMEAGYLSPVGRANHLLAVKWIDIQNLFTALNIQPANIEDYSIYDSDNWGFVTDSEKHTIGLFHAAFGRGIDTRDIEIKKFTLSVADIIYLVDSFAESEDIDVR